ncbi:unnamed protein product [Lasius platythorax]|uniref:Uncharacterized protein n=1 Tax=Lasius platythorax TaxID=488582 RepID=A0AAV2P425_9HYME
MISFECAGCVWTKSRNSGHSCKASWSCK